MVWLNFGGKKRKEAQGFGNSKQGKSRPRRKTFILEKIVTPSAGVGGWLHDLDPLHQLLGSLSLSDLHLPNFLADSGVCPIDPSGAPTNNLPPLIDFDPLGLYDDGIATQTTDNPGGAFETLPIAVIPVDPYSPNPNNPKATRQLPDFPLASQPLLGSIDTGVSADSPYLNYANIKKGAPAPKPTAIPTSAAASTVTRGTPNAEATVARAETFRNKLFWSGGSGPVVNNNDFTKWVMGQSNWRPWPLPPKLVWSPGPEPTLDRPRNNMNCWEMILFAAYKAGSVSREWLTKLYGTTTLSGTALTNWYANLPRRMASPIQTYQGGWNSGLRRGDIVFFNGAAHVAIATGTKDRFGNDEVISHWTPNQRRVEVTTIQALRKTYPSTVTFGRPAWNTARLT